MYGPLYVEDIQKVKFNWNEGKTSFTFFETFEHEWLKLLGQYMSIFTVEKYAIILQIVYDALTFQNEFLRHPSKI